jgi:hypothetical protein
MVAWLQVQEVQPQEVRRQQLIERSMMVNGAWQYLWCSVLHDAPFTTRDISVDICGPSLASLEWVSAALCVIFVFCRVFVHLVDDACMKWNGMLHAESEWSVLLWAGEPGKDSRMGCQTRTAAYHNQDA